MKLAPSGTAITALLALNSLSRLPLLVSAAPSPSPLAAELLLVQRSDAAHRDTATVPNCAQYQGTVGSARVNDLYLVTSPCRPRHAVQPAAETTSFVYDLEAFESQTQEVGPLFWLRPDDLDIEANLPVAAPSQLVLSRHHSASRSVTDLLVLLDPEFAPAHVIDLDPISTPSGSSALVSLSQSNSTHRLAQLEYLTSHPLLAHWTLVAVPLSSDRPALGEEGSPYPEVPKFAVNRIRHHLDALAFQPTLSAVIKSLEGKRAEERIRQDVQVLSGEDQNSLKEHEKVRADSLDNNAGGRCSTLRTPLCLGRRILIPVTCLQWVSRHSMSEGGHRASDWVHGEFSRAACPTVPPPALNAPHCRLHAPHRQTTQKSGSELTHFFFFQRFFRPLQRKCPRTVSTAPNSPT